jgi:hypothetical protein
MFSLSPDGIVHMQIFIKTLTGRRSNFNFEPDNTVRQVKEALQVCLEFLGIEQI